MPDVWNVTPNMVVLNGNPIQGYVSHELLVRNNLEGKPFNEVSIAVRVIDPRSEANREAPLAVLPPITQALVLAEYALRPSFSEYHAKAGDTITFSGTYTAGANDSGPISGSDPL